MAITFQQTTASTANTWTVTNDWVWNTVGTTTGTGITVTWDASDDDTFFTGGIHIEPQAYYRRQLHIDGRPARYSDFFKETAAGYDPMWARANETQEEKTARERRFLVTQVMHHAIGLLGANVDDDPVFDLERAIGLAKTYTRARFQEYEHLLPFLPEEERQLEDMWQRKREETIEIRRRQEEERLGEAERVRLAAVAERRAEQLLISLLSRAQKEEWLEFKRVTETAPSGRTWRLFPEWSGGAAIMDGSVRRATLCVHGAQRVPNADNMAMLLMTIRGDEERLIRIGVLHHGSFSEEEREIRKIRQADVDAAAA